jgi:hypothetical protein
MTRNTSRTIPRLSLLSAAALTVSLSTSDAGVCPLPVDARLAARAKAALGPSEPQSIAAQLHFQPTAASVAAAEARLGVAAHGMRRLHGWRCRQ